MHPIVRQMEDEMVRVKKRKEEDPQEEYQEVRKGLSTGLTMLNVALTGRVEYGVVPGRIINFVGDSSSGKTFLGLNVLAEASRNPGFEDYHLLYADSEHACGFDVDSLFGGSFAQRVEIREGDKAPFTVEDWECQIHELLDEGIPFVYVLDSLDSLSDSREVKKSEERVKAIRAGKEAKEDFGAYKAKQMSSILRRICSRIEQTGSMLIIISQTRDVMNAGPFEKSKSRSGGQALEFYCSHVVWLYNAGKIFRQHRNIKFQVGDKVLAKVEKNKITGKRRSARYCTYSDYGLDDLGSIVDFLIEVKEFSGTKKNLKWKGVLEAPAEDFPNLIEEQGLKKKLLALVQETWDEIEEALCLNRNPKYGE